MTVKDFVEDIAAVALVTALVMILIFGAVPLIWLSEHGAEHGLPSLQSLVDGLLSALGR